jgi:hypothetical protein
MINTNESIKCPVCHGNIRLNSLTIDPNFLRLLGKYKDDSSCVIDKNGIDHSLSMDEEQMEFKVSHDGRLISSIKRDLQMVMSSLP